jgi:hypothetical protein
MAKYLCKTKGCPHAISEFQFPVAMECPACRNPVVIEISYTDKEKLIIDRYPYVISYPFKKLLDESSYKQKLDLIEFTFRNIVKYYALVIASEYYKSDYSSQEINSVYQDYLSARVSLGNWITFAEKSIRELDNNIEWTFPEVKESFFKIHISEEREIFPFTIEYTDEKGDIQVDEGENDSALTAIYNFRNFYIGHGAPLPINEYQELFDKYYPILLYILEESSFLSRISMLKNERKQVYSLMGNIPRKANHIKIPGSKYEGSIWLQKDDDRILELLPYYVAPGQFTANTAGKAEVLVYEENTGKRMIFYSPESIRAESSGAVLKMLKLYRERKTKNPPIKSDKISKKVLRRRIDSLNKQAKEGLLGEGKILAKAHVIRIEAEAQLKGWIDSTFGLFFLASKAGSGKTSLLWRMNKIYTQLSHASIFIRACHMKHTSIIDELIDNLNLENEQAITKVIQLYSRSMPFIIIVDGLNEHPSNTAVLESIVKFLEFNKGGSLKIIISWRIIDQKEMPLIKLSPEIQYRVDGGVLNSSNNLCNSYLLSPFEIVEVEEMWNLYSKVFPQEYNPRFSFKGLFSLDKQLIEKLRTPYILRMFLELYNDIESEDVPIGYNSIWNLWWEKISTNSKEAEFLVEFANILYQAKKQQVPLDDLYDHPVLGEDFRLFQIDSIYSKLIRKNVLSEFFKQDILYVSFNFEGAMHYIQGQLMFFSNGVNHYHSPAKNATTSLL